MVEFIMFDVNIEKLNDVWLHITTSQSIKMELSDHFAFHVDGYKFHPKVKQRMWDGKIRLFQLNTGLLPIGLYAHLIKYCNQCDYSVDESVNENLKDPNFDSWVSELTVTVGGKVIKPRDYQLEAAKKIIFNRSQGLIECPTGSGKSLIQYIVSRWALSNLSGKVLITVPTKDLVVQMRGDLLDYSSTDDSFGSDDIHTIMGGKDKDPKDARIIISTWQSVCKLPRDWFEQFDCYMADEAHTATAKNITAIVQHLVDCPIKAGLSGTFKDSMSHVLALVGHFGNIFKPVTTRELIDDGTVAQLKVRTVLLQYPEKVITERKGLPYQTEIKLLTSDLRRNVKCCKLAKSIADKGKNVVLMYKHIKHGDELKRICDRVHDKVYITNGSTDVNDRDNLRAIAETEGGVIIIASTGVFSTGVNIKRLHAIIMTHPMKSKIVILQTIGRILRLHSSKSQAVFYDIVDDLRWKKWKSYSLKHAVDRIKLYNSQEFDYTITKVDL
jgi:superfamily II DNA or RNA helicase